MGVCVAYGLDLTIGELVILSYPGYRTHTMYLAIPLNRASSTLDGFLSGRKR